MSRPLIEEERQMLIFQLYSHSNQTIEMLNNLSDEQLMREYGERVVKG